MAFVLIQHLDPNHESRFSDILGRITQMPVQEVKGDTAILPNHLYVIPATSEMVISEGKLKLLPREETHGQPKIIDRFFYSLAKELQTGGIGVILSGTGSDGARGLIEIKAEGGITFAQDKTAKQRGMPQAAIAADCVDFVLSPDGIAKELAALSQHPDLGASARQRNPKKGSPAETPDANVVAILNLLRKSTGVDFTFYKQGTVTRRISRRMLLCKIDKPEAYLKFLQENPSEVAILQQDLLIRVTSFFRDPEVFSSLKNEVFPSMVKTGPHEQILRIWVPGCATGDEVYSIAICLIEFLDEKQLNHSLQIFGTDPNESCIERARNGEYSESSLAEVSPERLRKFFVKTNQGYQIIKSVRERCVFAKHDLTQDPPFSGLDLISCRNLLIYLEGELQKRVLSLFHYALKQNGFLLLGSSESIGGYGELFAPLDAKHKIFSKKLLLGHPHFDFAKGHLASERNETAKTPLNATTNYDLAREAERAIAGKFGPDGVIINEEMEVLQVRGRVGDFLEPASGQASHSLLKMARLGLLSDLRAAILKAKRDRVAVRKENIQVRENGDSINAYLEVLPLIASKSRESYFVVLFGEHTQSKIARIKKGNQKKIRPPASRTEELERELSTMQEYLQALIEKEQASNEELKSANEEILSSNEEMQSTNEELETAKEELQSVNEELSTLNDELQNRNHQLSIAVNDLDNLLVNVRIPVLMVSRDLKIRRITPGAEKVMNLIPTDVGRPMTDMNLNFPDLIPLLRDVIDNVTPKTAASSGCRREMVFAVGAAIPDE